MKTEKQILKTTITIEFAADETQLIAEVLALVVAARNDASTEGCCNVQPEPAEAKEPEPEKTIRVRRSEHTTNVTHDDVRDLMAEVLTDDDANRPKVMKQLKKIGVSNVGAIPPENLADFYEFLQSLRDE